MVRSSNGKDASLSRKKQKFNSSANHHYLCEYLLSCDLDKSHFIKFCDIFNIANLASSFNGQDIGLSRRRQGFNSRHQHHLFIRHLQQISKYKLCIVGSSPTVFHLLGDIAQLVRQKIILSVLNMRLWRNWQTRGSQTPLMATSFRFKSCQPHQGDFLLIPSEIRFSFQKI